ncbi:hypothetical protein [Dyella tabacisoli]|uniref:Uncharacterized protein n=1 Tax=Dyella tabacisoli TaxID=2282381 RepID=A0A369UJI6_9GAMM|nr:hypothetical protein [Dyella tabacisoli]RDD80701.1 hypothetical protein DVJ77_15840 [Dyella tabacisoli]
MSSLWSDLLFLHGHISNVDLAHRLSEIETPPSKPLGGQVKPLPSKSARAPKAADSTCSTACVPT